MEKSKHLLLSLLLLQGAAIGLCCTNGEFSPDPSDCNKFFQCSNGQQVSKSCNTGLYWNQSGKYCDYPATAGCSSDGKSSTSTSNPTNNPPSSTTMSSGGGGQIGQTRTGICSWYGDDGEIPPGWPTSCGQPFDRDAMAAATWPEVPCGSRLRVTDLDTGKYVDVVVDDRFGGAPKERIVDLTYGAFGKIANRDQGLIQHCKYEIIG